jgi:hypothetical protein
VLSAASGLYSTPYSEEAISTLLRNAGTAYQITRRYIPQDIKNFLPVHRCENLKLRMYLPGSSYGPVMGICE